LSEAKVKDLESVKNILLNEFDFWIWTTIVKKSNNWNEISLSDKLESFYKAEISSRNKVDLSNLWDNLEFNFENIISFAKEALNQEKDIINKYNWKKFIFNSTEFDVIVNWKINSILLRYVRKWEDIWDKNLKLLVGNYINSLNDWFDFIAPFVEKTQLEDIWKIETQIERWIIGIDLLKNTYKNTLSVNALKLESKWKEWLRVFIDIVDMWIMNLNDFRKLASRIVSWDIKKEDLSDLLSAWQTATNRFQNLVSSIKKSYPNAKISLWWDEVFIFIPWKTQLESQKIITDLTSKLKNEDLVWRISNSTNKDNDKIFDNLDWFTSINKFFEKKVEKIINNNSNVKVKNFWLSEIKTLRDLKFFSSINLNIDKKVQKIISENTSNFLIDLKNIIDYNMIKALIIWKKDSYNISFDIFDRNIEWMTMWKISNFNLNVSKASNNELIISIK
jgi:hypothetical protein